jgi:hypothetical protein
MTACTPTLYCPIRDDPFYPGGKLAYRVFTPLGAVPRLLDETPPLMMLQGMTAVKEDWFSFAGTSLLWIGHEFLVVYRNISSF